MTPVKAIREKCLDCMSGQTSEVRQCPCKDCSMWPFRMGKNPNRAKGKDFNSETKKGKIAHGLSE